MFTANATLKGNGTERGMSYGARWGCELRTLEPHLLQSKFWRTELPLQNEIKERHMNNVKRRFPDLANEIEGMATAAGVSVGTALNWVLIDGFSWGFFATDENMPAEPMCTNLSITDCCEEPMLMQTVDAPDAAFLIAHKIYPENGYAHMYHGRLGSVVATSGLNEKGLAIGGVSSYATSQDLDGFVCGMLIRACLQYCATVSDAVGLISEHSLMFGGYTVNCIDQSGKNVVIEKTPEDQAVRHSEGPYMFNTKFETPYMKEKNKAFQFDQWEKRGYNRLGTFKRLMESEPRPYSINTMERIMSDHSPNGPIWDWSTLMGYIMLPQSQKIRIYPGPPDYAAYEESTL